MKSYLFKGFISNSTTHSYVVLGRFDSNFIYSEHLLQKVTKLLI